MENIEGHVTMYAPAFAIASGCNDGPKDSGVRLDVTMISV